MLKYVLIFIVGFMLGLKLALYVSDKALHQVTGTDLDTLSDQKDACDRTDVGTCTMVFTFVKKELDQ